MRSSGVQMILLGPGMNLPAWRMHDETYAQAIPDLKGCITEINALPLCVDAIDSRRMVPCIVGKGGDALFRNASTTASRFSNPCWMQGGRSRGGPCGAGDAESSHAPAKGDRRASAVPSIAIAPGAFHGDYPR